MPLPLVKMGTGSRSDAQVPVPFFASMYRRSTARRAPRGLACQLVAGVVEVRRIHALMSLFRAVTGHSRSLWNQLVPP